MCRCFRGNLRAASVSQGGVYGVRAADVLHLGGDGDEGVDDLRRLDGPEGGGGHPQRFREVCLLLVLLELCSNLMMMNVVVDGVVAGVSCIAFVAAAVMSYCIRCRCSWFCCCRFHIIWCRIIYAPPSCRKTSSVAALGPFPPQTFGAFLLPFDPPPSPCW